MRTTRYPLPARSRRAHSAYRTIAICGLFTGIALTIYGARAGFFSGDIPLLIVGGIGLIAGIAQWILLRRRGGR